MGDRDMNEAFIASLLEKSIVAGAFVYMLYHFLGRFSASLEAVSRTLEKISRTLYKMDTRLDDIEKRIDIIERRDLDG